MIIVMRNFEFSNKVRQTHSIILLLFICSFLITILLGSCKKNETIVSNKFKIGGHTTQLGASIEIALVKELYKKYGLDVNIKRVESSKESMAAMEAGEFDVVIGSLSAGSFNLVRKGDLVILADGSRVIPSIIIRKDLWESKKIKNLQDLKGKLIMTPREGSSSSYALSKILQGIGFNINDIKPKYLDDNATLAALESKQIDVAILNEPQATNAVEKGIGIRYDLKEVEKFFPSDGQQHMVIYTCRKTLEEKPDLLRKFLEAYIEGIKFYDKARSGNQPERNEAVKIIAGYTGADSKIIERSLWPYVSPDGKPDIGYIKAMQDYFAKQGLVDKPVNIDSVVYLELLPVVK